MRIPATLLIGTSVFASAVSASAQTNQEAAAQAANPQPPAYQSGADIIVTATKRASCVQDVPFPRRRLASHEVEIEWCRPAKRASPDCDESLVARWRTAARFSASDRGGPKAKTFPPAARAS